MRGLPRGGRKGSGDIGVNDRSAMPSCSVLGSSAGCTSVKATITDPVTGGTENFYFHRTSPTSSELSVKRLYLLKSPKSVPRALMPSKNQTLLRTKIHELDLKVLRQEDKEFNLVWTIQ